MRRRNLVFGLLVVATVGTVHAQQSRKVYRIACAHASAPATDLTEGSRGSIVTRVILKELRRLRYMEDQNLLIERYSGEGRAEIIGEPATIIRERFDDPQGLGGATA